MGDKKHLVVGVTGRLWQIIPKRLPIILFFYSQIMSPLFFQTKPIILNYSYFS